MYAEDSEAHLGSWICRTHAAYRSHDGCGRFHRENVPGCRPGGARTAREDEKGGREAFSTAATTATAMWTGPPATSVATANATANAGAASTFRPDTYLKCFCSSRRAWRLLYAGGHGDDCEAGR